VSRVLIIPAAGSGSRLRSRVPKVLFPVAGRPMIDRLLDLYLPVVDRVIVVVHPAFEERVRTHCAGRGPTVEFAVQNQPTGMLDAILIPAEAARSAGPRDVWITWCDQIAVETATIERLAAWADRDTEAALIFPTLWRPDPYIHYERDASGSIHRVLHRREGDPMPDDGEGDIGLFHLSADAFFRLLPAFASEARAAAGTGERNFLPFIPWLGGRAPVRTFPATSMIESIGVNAPEDVERVEAHFHRGG